MHERILNDQLKQENKQEYEVVDENQQWKINDLGDMEMWIKKNGTTIKISKENVRITGFKKKSNFLFDDNDL